MCIIWVEDDGRDGAHQHLEVKVCEIPSHRTHGRSCSWHSYPRRFLHFDAASRRHLYAKAET
jgi:hypothetical protein